jgi:predicted helicase
MLKKTCNENIDEKIIKKAYFMLKSMLFNGDKKCICYMTCIEFADNMYNILSWLSKLLNIKIEYWKIDCNTKKTVRETIINNFKVTNKIAILINVHILDEGINIPECDSVFITQPSNNMINIIQRMCRANRVIDNKSNCNIYLWCKENKTKIILDYILENTDGFIKDRVFIYNTKDKIIIKHNMKIISDMNNNIDSHFNYNIKLSENFNIKDIDVAKYLGISLITLRNRLKNVYSKTKRFIEKKDYIRVKTGTTSGVIFYINYECFSKLAMSGDSANSETIRMHFIKLRKLIVENQHLIHQAI